MEKPIHFIYEGEKEDFLKAVAKDLRERHLDTVKYFTGYKVK